MEIALQHLHGDLPTYAGPEPASTAINSIYRLSLAKDPGDRYPTANAMRSDLLEALKGVRETGEQPQHPQKADDTPTLRQSPATVSTEAAPAHAKPWRLLTALGVAVTFLVVGAAVLLGPELVSRDTACPGGPDAGADGGCPESEETSSANGDVTCWTGARAEVPSDCSQPSGLDGLRWAFPSLDRDFPSCYRPISRKDDPETDASLKTWFCPAPGTRTEGIGYTEWTSPEAARAHFDDVFGSASSSFVIDGSTIGRQWMLREANSKGYFKYASLYEQFPLSATVWAESPEDVARFCAALTARSLRTFSVEPVECEPVP